MKITYTQPPLESMTVAVANIPVGTVFTGRYRGTKGLWLRCTQLDKPWLCSLVTYGQHYLSSLVWTVTEGETIGDYQEREVELKVGGATPY